MAAATKTFTLSLTDEECTELLDVLEKVLIETHAERRRTESPTYRDQVTNEESVLRGLVEKVRRFRE
jgi:hypothetical protein